MAANGFRRHKNETFSKARIKGQNLKLINKGERWILQPGVLLDLIQFNLELLHFTLTVLILFIPIPK